MQFRFKKVLPLQTAGNACFCMKFAQAAVMVMPRHSRGFLPIELLDPGPGPACWPGTRPGGLPLPQLPNYQVWGMDY